MSVPANSISWDALRAWRIGCNSVPWQIFREILKLIANWGRRLPGMKQAEVGRFRRQRQASVLIQPPSAFYAPAPPTNRFEHLSGAWSVILSLPKSSESAILASKLPGIWGTSE
jgi:hypothetical protein